MGDSLEGNIDPFDLDVFTPPLNSNPNRLSQRTSVRVPPPLAHTETRPHKNTQRMITHRTYRPLKDHTQNLLALEFKG